MHLTECFDFANVSARATYSSSECVKDWFLKSTTEFYGWDERLHLNYLFGALCWNYSLAGIVMLFIEPSWTKKSWFPYRTLAYVLILIQGPLSFSADYLSMTKDSNIHVIDRLMAIINFQLQSWKVLTLTFYGRPSTVFCQFCGIIYAITSFMNSQESQQSLDPDGFIFWHNAWHCYPMIAIFIEIFDFYLGEYDVSKNGSVWNALGSTKVRVTRTKKCN